MMKVAQLTINPETDRLEHDGHPLFTGDCLEVLVVNGLSGRPEWIETRLEMADDWYLVGLLGYQVNGLFARMDLD